MAREKASLYRANATKTKTAINKYISIFTVHLPAPSSGWQIHPPPTHPKYPPKQYALTKTIFQIIGWNMKIAAVKMAGSQHEHCCNLTGWKNEDISAISLAGTRTSVQSDWSEHQCRHFGSEPTAASERARLTTKTNGSFTP